MIIYSNRYLLFLFWLSASGSKEENLIQIVLRERERFIIFLKSFVEIESHLEARQLQEADTVTLVDHVIMLSASLLPLCAGPFSSAFAYNSRLFIILSCVWDRIMATCLPHCDLLTSALRTGKCINDPSTSCLYFWERKFNWLSLSVCAGIHHVESWVPNPGLINCI